jgi:hypothetical protein
MGVGQAKPHTLNMQQLSDVGIGCPATSWKKSLKVALAKHSAETCVAGAVVSSATTRLHTAEGNPSDFVIIMLVFLPNRQTKMRWKSRIDSIASLRSLGGQKVQQSNPVVAGVATKSIFV